MSPRLDLRRLLYQATSEPATRQLAIRILTPVLTYDRNHGGDLIHTMQVYFASNGNASKAAQRLFLHRNGLLYRLSRIEDLLGVSLNEPDCRLALELALLCVKEQVCSR